jgi:hypothetical protein
MPKRWYQFGDYIAAGGDLTQIRPFVEEDGDSVRRRRFREMSIRVAIDCAAAVIALAFPRKEDADARDRR